MAQPAALNNTYWLVACSQADQSREAIYSILKSRVSKGALVSDICVFDVPLNLKTKSFDDLIRQADDLAKYDLTCETVLRRLERQVLETDASAELKVIWQRTPMTVEEYLHRFQWDDAKFSRSSLMTDVTAQLMTSVQRLDEEVRAKTAAFNELKQHHSTTAKKDNVTFLQKDLADVLTPDVVSDDDFVETEHLTTAVVVIPRGLEAAWQKSYESLDEFVVPRSSKNFGVVDKEGSTLWSVVLFKTALESFRTAARAKRFTVRDFKFNRDAYQQKQEERIRLEAEKDKQEGFISRVCLAAFSDIFVSWIHLKSMRVFVEAVLRYGVPPDFATFMIKPNPGKAKKLRKELEEVFTTKGMFGKSLVEGESTGADNALVAELGGDEEYLPYVSISLVPFVQFVQK